jgi:hypothetical protein
MKPRLNDALFKFIPLNLPESLEQSLRDDAAKAGLSLNLFLSLVLSEKLARCVGDTCKDYRYSGHPD